jgi:hypothetical protein
MNLPTSVLAFRPFCDEPGCPHPEMVGSDFCKLHSGCSYVIGFRTFAYDCGDEVVEILDEENGRCHSHRTASCTYCDNDALDPGAPETYADLCWEHADEASYEAACDNGYTGPRYR